MKRHDALTSEQVKQIPRRKAALFVLVMLAGWLAGCSILEPNRAPRLRAPYERRQVFAVAPLGNESGSLYADGVRVADRLAEQLTVVANIDTVPVNRVLAQMERMHLSAVTTKTQALALRSALGVDGLVVGTITSYEPYDPPKLGMNIELYLDPKHESSKFDIRLLSRQATDRGFRNSGYAATDQPVSTLSTFFDAADPAVQDRLESFVGQRGVDYGGTATDARLYRISSDLYTHFVAYEVCRRLMIAETLRLTPPPPTTDGSAERVAAK